MKVGYLNFDEYIRQGDPSQREKAGYWQTAFLHIHSTAEWCVQPNLTDSTSTRTSTRTSTGVTAHQ